jgi:hypothetical protein
MKLYFNPTSTLSLCGHRAVNPPYPAQLPEPRYSRRRCTVFLVEHASLSA